MKRWYSVPIGFLSCVITCHLLGAILEVLGVILFIVGGITMFFALIWSFIVVARENAILAVICLFLPMGLLVALLLRVQRPWRPLGLWMVGLAALFGGLSLVRPGS